MTWKLIVWLNCYLSILFRLEPSEAFPYYWFFHFIHSSQDSNASEQGDLDSDTRPKTYDGGKHLVGAC